MPHVTVLNHMHVTCTSYQVSVCTYLSLEQYADVVVGNRGAVQRGTLINLLHYHKMEGPCNGRQGTAEVRSLGELDLCQVCVCVL